jgi:prepilin-type N-terminal cleavage/methylation domain-containing protein
MNTRRQPKRVIHAELGFTLIELIVAMALGTFVSLAGLSFLIFTTNDVSRISERVHVDQTARVALERVMLRLHTACVAPSVEPVQVKSNENTLKFISESGEKSELSEIKLHEIIFAKPSGTKKGTLVEKIYEPSKATNTGSSQYTFKTTPMSTITLLTGIKNSESSGEAIPVFRYYRYYKASDPLPTGYTTTPYQLLYPNPLSNTVMENQEEAKYVAKVTVSFTAVPEGTEPVTFNHDRAVPLEDSAVFRLATASETQRNEPCSKET